MTKSTGERTPPGTPDSTAQSGGDDERALLPFAPLLYVAWSDGTLTADELRAIGERIDARPLRRAVKREVRRWLDPDRPPTPARLAELLALVRRHAESLPDEARHSLAEAGAALARESGVSEEDEAALAELEAALGIAGAEALRGMLAPAPAAADDTDAPVAVHVAAPPHEAAAFDPAALHALLDADHAELRARVLTLLASPEFARPVASDSAEYRQRVFDWCRRLAAEGMTALALPREFGGEHDVSAGIAVFETLAYHDLSLTVKFGVQVGLFGGSILMLGTRRHHERYLRAAATLELPGCFAMTETGHGSNVREIETTATYDHDRAEFVIHTPHESARKDYIGNAALHGRIATVFAQLDVAGQRHGVHAFLVPIRADDGTALPGVRIEDCGPKFGLNGVDNGRLAFDHVRIGRDDMLDRFGAVGDDGVYRSPISSSSRRFFTMLGTLVAGRISVAAASLSASKSALTIAVRYAARRRQFGPEGAPEVPILRYLAVQRALMPGLATSVALDFAIADLVREFAAGGGEGSREIEAVAAGLKAYASRHAVDTVRAAREVCGGQGYLAENRIPALIEDTDIFTTFEGANDVLLQLVAKSMLTEYQQQFSELRIWGALRYVAQRARAALADLNPVQPRRTDADHLRSPRFHDAAFAFRNERLLASLARRLKSRIDSGLDSFDALNECQDHALAAATAHIEHWILQRLHAAVAGQAGRPLEPILQKVATLYALARLDADTGWFLKAGYFEAAKARAIRAQVNVLCGEVAESAESLVAAFGIPDAVLDAPIAAR